MTVTVRSFSNEILAFIDSESLTDEEYESMPEGLSVDYSKATYEALKAVLQTRDGVSAQLKKLKAYFIAKGADLTAPARDPNSQILVGCVLD